MNKQMKSVLLNVIKDRHSILFFIDEKDLYTEEYILEYMQHDNSTIAKNMFIVIDSNFMDSVEKTNENEYRAKLQMIFPDDWCYYFQIQVIDDQCLVSYLEIDP